MYLSNLHDKKRTIASNIITIIKLNMLLAYATNKSKISPPLNKYSHKYRI